MSDQLDTLRQWWEKIKEGDPNHVRSASELSRQIYEFLAENNSGIEILDASGSCSAEYIQTCLADAVKQSHIAHTRGQLYALRDRISYAFHMGYLPENEQSADRQCQQLRELGYPEEADELLSEYRNEVLSALKRLVSEQIYEFERLSPNYKDAADNIEAHVRRIIDEFTTRAGSQENESAQAWLNETQERIKNASIRVKGLTAECA